MNDEQIISESGKDTKDMAVILTGFFGLIYAVAWAIDANHGAIIALWALFMGLNLSIHIFTKMNGG